MISFSFILHMNCLLYSIVSINYIFRLYGARRPYVSMQVSSYIRELYIIDFYMEKDIKKVLCCNSSYAVVFLSIFDRLWKLNYQKESIQDNMIRKKQKLVKMDGYNVKKGRNSLKSSFVLFVPDQPLMAPIDMAGSRGMKHYLL